MNEARQLVDTIVKGIQEKKGSRIVVADLRNIEGAIAKYFVICQGGSPQQVEAITDSVTETTRTDISEKPTRTVGLEQALWVAMDYGDVLVHIFVPDMRDYYDLEHLWEDAPMEHIEDED
jgi:ribosome-associated protein